MAPKTAKFIFSNVDYRPTVYETGHKPLPKLYSSAPPETLTETFESDPLCITLISE